MSSPCRAAPFCRRIGSTPGARPTVINAILIHGQRTAEYLWTKLPQSCATRGRTGTNSTGVKPQLFFWNQLHSQLLEWTLYQNARLPPRPRSHTTWAMVTEPMVAGENSSYILIFKMPYQHHNLDGQGGHTSTRKRIALSQTSNWMRRRNREERRRRWTEIRKKTEMGRDP